MGVAGRFIIQLSSGSLEKKSWELCESLRNNLFLIASEMELQDIINPKGFVILSKGVRVNYILLTVRIFEPNSVI